MSHEMSTAQRAKLGRIWKFGLAGVMGATIGLWVLAIAFCPPKYPPACEPLLSTPGVFTLLAIVIALSAYLRSVAGNADEHRHQIRAGKLADFYPIVKPLPVHTEGKLRSLDGTYERLQAGARVLIWLCVAISCRLLAECIVRSGYYISRNGWVLRCFDLCLVVWLTGVVLVLSVMHYNAYKRDELTRTALFDWLAQK